MRATYTPSTEGVVMQSIMNSNLRKRCGTGIMLMVLGGAGSLAAAAPLPIVARHSGKCLDVRGGPGATQNGALVEQWECTSASNQNWTMRDAGGGQVELVAAHSSK